ncbi:MAG: glycerate kinase [Armatimonadota bacterium]
MKIVIAPDSFKGSLTASEVADAVAVGLLRAVPNAELDIVPLADGGEGTVEALVRAAGGQVRRMRVTGPLGEPVDAFYGLLNDGTAVVEMAAASGLPLVPVERRDPRVTTTYGTGELIRAALDAGCRRIILGIGGSATNDGGIGAMQALGASFRDADGREVGLGGRELARIRSIDLSGLDARIARTGIVVACDVDNPLTGPRGASAVFGPQKGATPDMVSELDAGLRNLAELMRALGKDVESAPGAGAAGGLGAAAMAFLSAEMRPGIDIVLEAVRFPERVRGAELIVTGEGRIDSQTLSGKTISGVLRVARCEGVPVLAIGGGVEKGGYELLNHGAVAVLPIVNGPMTLEEAQERAAELISAVCEQAARLFRQAKKGPRS